MNFSPLKTSLFEFDFKSSNKKAVSCEINSWMETHAKPTLAIPRPLKNCRQIRLHNSPSQRTNFSKLKEMHSSLLKNTMRKFSQRTPLTADSNSPLTDSISGNKNSNGLTSFRVISVQKQQVKPIRIIQVSEFKQFDNHTSSQPSTAERKPSLLRLRALSKKGNRQQNINHLILGKEANIIENKVTENQYCGLKFVARRLVPKTKN